MFPKATEPEWTSLVSLAVDVNKTKHPQAARHQASPGPASSVTGLAPPVPLHRGVCRGLLFPSLYTAHSLPRCASQQLPLSGGILRSSVSSLRPPGQVYWTPAMGVKGGGFFP